MKTFTYLCAFLLVFSACTQKSDSTTAKSQNRLKYDSPISYQYKVLETKDAAAMVQETPVTWSQLLSNDVALQELQQRYQEQGIVFAYAWAESLSQEGDNLKLTLHFSQPEKDLSEIVASSGMDVSEAIEVSFEETSKSELLASVGDKNLTWEEFQASSIQHSKLYDRLFQQRMQRLNGIVVRRYLLEASKEANLGMEEFVRTKILAEPIQPTEDDVRAFAADKGISESDLDETMIERLKEIVKQNDRDEKIENYVAKNLIKAPIHVAFKSPKIKVDTPEIGENMPQWGKSEGPELVFVGHWNCEDCGGSLKTFLQTRDQYNKKMKGAFIYSFPSRDREARMGAEAALCVKDQSAESFWTFLTKVVDIEGDGVEDRLNLAAQSSGVDYDKFRDCFLKRQHQEDVEAHLRYAQSLGMTSAPLLILQGQVLDLPIDTQALSLKLKEMGVTTQSQGGGLWSKIKAFFGF